MRILQSERYLIGRQWLQHEVYIGEAKDLKRASTEDEVCKYTNESFYS